MEVEEEAEGELKSEYKNEKYEGMRGEGKGRKRNYDKES